MNIFGLLSSFFKSNKTTQGTVLTIQKEGAELAKEQARVLNLKLNYSDDSIKVLDKILRRLTEVYSVDKDKEILERSALLYGLYVIEVFERNHEKGYLERNLLGLEKDNFPYYWKGNLIFPCLWCLDKIFNPEAEDVWTLYQAAISKN